MSENLNMLDNIPNSKIGILEHEINQLQVKVKKLKKERFEPISDEEFAKYFHGTSNIGDVYDVMESLGWIKNK